MSNTKSIQAGERTQCKGHGISGECPYCFDDLGDSALGMTKLQARQVALAREISGMSDDQIRYQVEAHERHDDYGWTFDLYVNEYRERGLRKHGDWQDAGEIRMGA